MNPTKFPVDSDANLIDCHIRGRGAEYPSRIVKRATPKPVKLPHSVCRTCGTKIGPRRCYCSVCSIPAATEHIKNGARDALGGLRNLRRLSQGRRKRSDRDARCNLLGLHWTTGTGSQRKCTGTNYSPRSHPSRALPLPLALVYRAAPRVTFARVSCDRIGDTDRRWRN